MNDTECRVSVRAIEAGDLDRIVELDRALTGQSRRGFYEKRLAAAGEAKAFISLAATSDGGIAGFVMAHVLDGEFGGLAPVAVLDAIGVDPAVRGRGVARHLMAALDSELAARRVGEVQTEAGWTEHDLLQFFHGAGFALAPRLVLAREIDATAPGGDDFDAESRDAVPVRSLAEADLPALIGIDRRITGRDRSAYYRRKLAEVTREAGVRVSLVAEQDGQVVGFVMARADYGEFGRTVPAAVIDTIGVNPAFGRRAIGRALMSQLLVNLASLRIERVHTPVAWDNFPLLAFLARAGFHPSQRLSFSRGTA